MTQREYLNDVFVLTGNEGDIEFYKAAVQGRGEVLVEHNVEDETCSIIHLNKNNREDFYEVDNLRDLKDTVEYCLGPMISDSQWRGGSKSKDDEYYLDEDWDESNDF